MEQNQTLSVSITTEPISNKWLHQLDQSVAKEIVNFYELFGPLAEESLNVVMFLSHISREKVPSLFNQITWTTPEFIKEADVSRTIYQSSYKQVLSDEEINWIKQKYGNFDELSEFDWIITTLDLVYFLLLNAKLRVGTTYGKSFNVSYFSILNSISLDFVGKKKVYTCELDPGFIERSRIGYFNKIKNYNSVPTGLRLFHAYLSRLKESVYNSGKSNYIVSVDELVDVFLLSSESLPKHKKLSVTRKMKDYINAKNYTSELTTFEYIKEATDNYSYKIKLSFTPDERSDKRILNYKNIEAYKDEYLPQIHYLFNNVNEIQQKEKGWKFTYDEWYYSPNSKGADSKHRYFIQWIKKHYPSNKEISESLYSVLFKKEFNYLSPKSFKG